MTSRGERGRLATSILKSMQVHRVAPPRLQDKVKHVFRCFGYRLFRGTTTRYNQVFHAIGSLVVSRLNLTGRSFVLILVRCQFGSVLIYSEERKKNNDISELLIAEDEYFLHTLFRISLLFQTFENCTTKMFGYNKVSTAFLQSLKDLRESKWKFTSRKSCNRLSVEG